MQDEGEAYRLANDTEFGLAAGVFTTDIARANRAAEALDAGTVWINCYQVTDLRQCRTAARRRPGTAAAWVVLRWRSTPGASPSGHNY